MEWTVVTDRTRATPCLVALLVALAGCGGGDRNVVEPPLPPPTDFTLTLRAHPEDVAVAQQLGWSGGIPAAEVTITPSQGSGAVQRLTTGADGTVKLDALAPDSYRLTARRMFTPSELAKLGAGSDAVAFVGEDEVGVGNNTRTVTVTLPASRRRSLVISEWSFNSWQSPTSNSYLFGGYLELYNNSDTTVYLDGVLIARAGSALTALPHLSCEAAAPVAMDPDGLWASEIASFPGSGRQYPLAPGGVVVVATDAIDHSALLPDMLDLRGADFEFMGPADVDNPSVPNMLDVGTGSPFFGHGLFFPGTDVVVVLGEAVDPRALRRAGHPVNGDPWLRIDRARMLDVLATTNTIYSTLKPPPIYCAAMISTTIDRQHAVLGHDQPGEHLVSISRKVLDTLPDGRLLLQHTRTSANDYHRTPRTPGVVR